MAQGLRTVIHNASVLDTINLKKIEDQTIVIKNGQIIWLGNYAEFEREENDTIVDAEGKYVTPGLMDLHVHLNFHHEGLQDRAKYLLRYKTEYWDYLALRHAQDYLRYGFTTLRGCGGNKGLASLRTIFNEGKMVGPRLKLALNTITQPGNQELFGPMEYVEVVKEKQIRSGRDGVIDAVRDRKADGADLIKTTTTGGVLHGQESKVERSLWRQEELEVMVDEAERLGMYVAAHAHSNAGILAAVTAGVRSIEHSTMLEEETIDEMLRKGTYLVATQAAGTYIMDAPDAIKSKLPPEVVSKWETVSAKMVQSHQMAYEKEVPIALGTDAPVAGEHCHSPKELNLLVKNVGMTPFEAIQAGTHTAARIIRMEDQLGNIEVGKLADLVVLDRDPTEDITVFGELDAVRYVFKEGKLVSQLGQLKHGY